MRRKKHVLYILPRVTSAIY